MADEHIVQGIMPSEASTIVENAFRGVLGFGDDQLAQVSPNDKFGKYCDDARMGEIRDFVQNDPQGGLPSMSPPRTILNQAISDVKTGSAIRLLIQRLSDYAYYPVAGLILLLCLGTVSLAQFASYRRSDNRVGIQLGMDISKITIKRIYLLTGSDLVKSYAAQPVTSAFKPEQIEFTVESGSIPADLQVSPVQVEVLLVDEKGKSSYLTFPLKEVGFNTTMKAMIADLKSKTAEAEGKDNAELYLSGTFTAAVGSKPNWIADTKYERQFYFDNFPFVVAPFANLNYDSKPKETDKLSFGVKFSKGFSFRLPNNRTPTNSLADVEYDLLSSPDAKNSSKAELKRLQRTWSERQYFDYSGTVEFESDWDFKVNNLITSQELKYLIRPATSRSLETRALFTPMIGAELGENLKNPLLPGRRPIARLKAGADLVIKKDKPFGTNRIKDLVWDSTFVQRWFAKSEFAFDKDDDGKLIFKSFGRLPRPHFKSELSFKFNEYFGPAISYEWGEEPPLYKKVDHKATIKLVYSFTRKTAL
jgi:hypothetical protein